MLYFYCMLRRFFLCSGNIFIPKKLFLCRHQTFSLFFSHVICACFSVLLLYVASSFRYLFWKWIFTGTANWKTWACKILHFLIKKRKKESRIHDDNVMTWLYASIRTVKRNCPITINMSIARCLTIEKAAKEFFCLNWNNFLFFFAFHASQPFSTFFHFALPQHIKAFKLSYKYFPSSLNFYVIFLESILLAILSLELFSWAHVTIFKRDDKKKLLLIFTWHEMGWKNKKERKNERKDWIKKIILLTLCHWILWHEAQKFFFREIFRSARQQWQKKMKE